MKSRKRIPQKTKAILQKDIGSVCPFCQNTEVDHFEFHHIDENPENNELLNLIMLCPICHSKITKGDISKEEVLKIKQKLDGNLQPKLAPGVEKLLEKARKLRNDSKFKEANKSYSKALKLAENLSDLYSIAKCKLVAADTLGITSGDADQILAYLNASEMYFRETGLEGDLAETLFVLSMAKLRNEQFDDARINLFEALEINKRLKDKVGEADCYLQIGWIEHGRGHLDSSKEFLKKSVEIFEQEYTKYDKQVITSHLAEGYMRLGMLNEAKGEITEANINFTKALKYSSDAEFKYSKGRALFLIADLKLRSRQFEKGLEYLNESLNIFTEIEDYTYVTKALNLLGSFHYSFGDKNVGIELFHLAIATIEKTNNVSEKISCYRKLAELYRAEKRYEDAEKLFFQLIYIAENEDDFDEYFLAVIGVINLIKNQDRKQEVNQLVKKGVEKLKRAQLKAQRESQRAKIFGDIGALYFEAENYIEARKFLLFSKEAYVSLSDKYGVARCVGSLAHLYNLTHEQSKERDAYRELRELTEGTHFYYEQSVAAFHLCLFEIYNKNFEQAKTYLYEAEYLNYYHELDIDEEIDDLQRRLDLHAESHQLPERTIREMIFDFYSLVNFYPKERLHLLRFWLFMHGNELFTAIRYEEGLKFLIVTNDTDRFLALTSLLGSYSDFSIQSFNECFSHGKSTIFHYPNGRLLPKGLYFAAIQKGHRMPADLTGVKFSIHKMSRMEFEEGRKQDSILRKKSNGQIAPYTLFLTDRNDKNDYSELYKKNGIELYDGHLILGYPIIFPEKFETLLLNLSEEELLDKKIFFDLTDRARFSDKFYSDLNFSKQLGCIPIFENSLPKSKRIAVRDVASLEIPIFIEPENNQEEIRRARNLILRFSQNLSEKSSLQNLKFELERSQDTVDTNMFRVEAYILELELNEESEKMRQLAFVYK